MLQDKSVQTAPAGSSLCHESHVMASGSRGALGVVTSGNVVTCDMGPVIAEMAHMGGGGQTIAQGQECSNELR